MRVTYRYRLFPTKSQRTALNRQLACCRWVYNKGLEIRRDAWQDERRSLSRYDTVKMLPAWKAEHDWLKAGHARAMQEALTRVHHCPHCGLVLDRDHNSALVILSRGLATLGSSPRSSPVDGGE